MPWCACLLSCRDTWLPAHCPVRACASLTYPFLESYLLSLQSGDLVRRGGLALSRYVRLSLWLHPSASHCTGCAYCLLSVLCAVCGNTSCCRQSTATLCTVHTVVLRNMLTVEAQAWVRCLLQLCKTICGAGAGEAQQAAAGPPRALPLSVGAAAEDRLPEQPLRAPGGALRLPVHLPRLQPLLLLPRQVL